MSAGLDSESTLLAWGILNAFLLLMLEASAAFGSPMRSVAVVSSAESTLIDACASEISITMD